MKTLRLKVKRESYGWLNAAARKVNFVWNWANESSEKAIRRFAGKPIWLSAYDLHKLSAGSSILFSRINASTIERVCSEYASKRNQFKRARLSWRKSGGSKRSLGWIPFRSIQIARRESSIRFCGKAVRIFEKSKLFGEKLHDGCFAQDACGDWWFCMPVDVERSDIPAPNDAIGVDLGLKALATMSNGVVSQTVEFYRTAEVKLARAQRRGHRRQAKRIHRKVKRQRQDALHKLSRMLVNTYQNIFIGDVSSSKLAKTRMAKSVHNVAWTTLRTKLQYKGQQAGRRVEIVDEAYTTRACSNCGQLTGPKGLRQLVVRQWRCECGVTHDRDVNAARNILAAGLRYQPPFAGTSKTVHEYRRLSGRSKEDQGDIDAAMGAREDGK